MLANRLAKDPKDWTEVFKVDNSGTYNNQFMVLDLNKIDLKEHKFEEGAFYIIEQMPGYTESAEVTEHLLRGYWPSYNIPFLRNIQIKAGYDKMKREHPDLLYNYDYSSSVRGRIFRRDQGDVQSLEAFKRIMRYNDYEKDEFSDNNAAQSISSRYDLNDPPRTKGKKYCFGAIDVKFASLKELKEGKGVLHIVSGPTDQGQPNFDYRTTKCVETDPERWWHENLVEEWKFEWVEYKLELFK